MVRLGEMMGFDKKLLFEEDPTETDKIFAALNERHNFRVEYPVTDVAESLWDFAQDHPGKRKLLIVDQVQNLVSGRDHGALGESFRTLRDAVVENDFACLALSWMKQGRGEEAKAWGSTGYAYQNDFLWKLERKGEDEHGTLVRLRQERLRWTDTKATVWLRIEKPHGTMTETEAPARYSRSQSAKPTELAEKVVAAVASVGAAGLVTGEVVRAVPGRDKAVREALRLAEKAGRLEKRQVTRKRKDGRTYRPSVWVAVAPEPGTDGGGRGSFLPTGFGPKE